MKQIIYWNLVDGYAYVQSDSPETISASQGDMTIGENYFYGGLLRFDLSPKPSYYRLRDLIQNKWHTKEKIVTDNNGKATFIGFFGNYELEILFNGKKYLKTINLSSKNTKSLCAVFSAISLCAISLVMTSLAGDVPSIILFPLFNGLGIIFVCVGSAFVFKEKLTVKKIIGLFLGVLGLCLINF